MIKLKKKYKRGELAKILLIGLAAGGFIVVCAALPGLGIIYKLFGARSASDRHRVRQSLKGLEHQNLVRVYSHKGKKVVEITKQGKRKILGYKLDEMKLTKTKKDGLMRVVMFDIPESKKHVRDELRFRLKGMGFEPLQDSSFMTPYECKDEVDFLRAYYELGDRFIYLKTRKIYKGT